MPSDRATMWSGTQFNLKAFVDQQNEAAGLGWTCMGQLEECPDTQRQHYQFAVKTPQVRWSAVTKVFKGAHIEVARNKAALEQYVKKEDTRIGELPQASNKYPALDQYWSLVVNELANEHVDKNHRMDVVDGHWWWKHNKEDVLESLDYATDILIRRGYRVETHAVNPQVRSAWAKFHTAIVVRQLADRQTDRQVEFSSDSITIPTTEDAEDQGDDAESVLGEDQEDQEPEGDYGSDDSPDADADEQSEFSEEGESNSESE